MRRYTTTSSSPPDSHEHGPLIRAQTKLLIDIGRYKEHRDVKVLICFVHDPDRRIQNPNGLEGHLTGPHDHLQVIVVVG